MLNIGPAADLTLCPHRRSEDDPKKDSFSMVSSKIYMYIYMYI
jgi:hypothetical protein